MLASLVRLLFKFCYQTLLSYTLQWPSFSQLEKCEAWCAALAQASGFAHQGGAPRHQPQTRNPADLNFERNKQIGAQLHSVLNTHTFLQLFLPSSFGD